MKEKSIPLVSEKELRWLLKQIEKGEVRKLGAYWIVRLAKTLAEERNEKT